MPPLLESLHDNFVQFLHFILELRLNQIATSVSLDKIAVHFTLQVHADVPLNPTDEVLHLAQAALTPHSCPAGLDLAVMNGDEMFGKFL